MQYVRTSTIIRTIFQYVKPFKWLALLTILSVVCAEALHLLVPWYYKRFFDVLTETGGTPASIVPHLIGVLVSIIALEAVSWLFFRIALYANNSFQPRVSAAMQQGAFRYILGHSHSFFVNTFTGSLVSRVRRFVGAFETLSDLYIWNVLQLAMATIGILIALTLRSWMIALAVLIWMVLMAILLVSVALWKLPYDVRKAEQDSRVSAMLADAVTNSTNVKLFTGHQYEFLRFARISNALQKLRTFTWNVGETAEAVQTALMIGVEFAVMYIGIKLWARGSITIGDFVMFQGYLMMLFGRFWHLGRFIRRTYEAIADAREMVEVFELPHEVHDVPGAKALHVRDGVIEFHDVVFNYRQTRRVLNRLNITIRSKEKVALVGPSGAGKSTIVKLLFRLYDVTDGAICIDGQQINQVTQESLRKNVALVPQDPILFHRSLIENIRYGRRGATNREVFSAAKRARCHGFISELPNGYQTLVGERGVKLSGGERQRVAIARAILANTPILVLDEATSSLDSESESLIQEALRELVRDKTVIVIAHRLSTILTMDRIIVIQRGVIVQEGTHEQLLRAGGLYKTLWNIQAGGFLA
ncbi:MAG: ABC transporter ATP-binding protein [Candidatus Uhrbacteria bacterium]